MSEIPWTVWLWGLAKKGGKGVVDNIDARALGRLADDIVGYHAEIERLQAQKAALEEALREYACTASDHPCGCYDQFLSEKAEIERLRALVHLLANDLEGELRGRYGPAMDYPSERRKFGRDMTIVYAARAALAGKEGK